MVRVPGIFAITLAFWPFSNAFFAVEALRNLAGGAAAQVQLVSVHSSHGAELDVQKHLNAGFVASHGPSSPNWSFAFASGSHMGILPCFFVFKYVSVFVYAKNCERKRSVNELYPKSSEKKKRTAQAAGSAAFAAPRRTKLIVINLLIIFSLFFLFSNSLDANLSC